MAKKKEAAVSPFVPVEEQPYRIPENWCWTYGSVVLEAMESQKPIGDEFDYIDIDAIDNQKQIVNNPKRLFVSEAPSRASRKLHAGDTVFSLVRPYLKNIAYIDDSLAHCIASTGFFVCTPKEMLSNRYLYQLMVSPYMVDGLNQYMKGDNSPSIRKDDIERFPFPVPPLPEQHRIVSRIESLFAKLDEAKEKAQAVVDGFELRKSAILHKAFTGELTAGWRKENGEKLNSWEKVSFDKCISKMQNGLAKRKGSIGKSYVVLRLANLNEDGFDTSELREILLDEKEQEAYALSENDVIMIRVNGSKDNVGRQVLVPKVDAWAFCDHIIRIQYLDNILPRYMVLFSKSDYYRLYIEKHMVSSAGQNTISRKGMVNLIVPIPKDTEQAEIVHILDGLLAQEQQAKEAAETVLDKIDTMKKAILARAFRGELGTNDPMEESVVELVKTVLQE